MDYADNSKENGNIQVEAGFKLDIDEMDHTYHDPF